MLKKIKNISFSSLQFKILMFFFILFLIIILLFFIPLGLYLNHLSQRDTKELAYQQLVSLDSSFVMSLKSRNSIVDILMLNKPFEQQTISGGEDLNAHRAIQDSLTRILVNDLDLISAAYFYDDGEALVATSSHLYKTHQEVLHNKFWRDLLEEANNATTYVIDGGGAIEMIKSEEPFVSFVRSVNSIVDFRRIGIIMLNTTSKKLGEIMQSHLGSSTHAYLYNQNSEIIASTNNIQISLEELLGHFSDGDNSKTIAYKGNKYVVSRYKSEIVDLSYVSIVPLTGNVNIFETNFLFLMGILVVLVLVFGQVYISRNLRRPLTQMYEYMHMAEEENFQPIPIKNENAKDEITQLQLFFNRMVMATNALVQRILEKERLKKEHEIMLIHEQIKPHFLYNALDAISALTLMEDNQTAYELTQAMSSFYRTVLSGGYQVIPFKTELESIKNYVTILNIRHENSINMIYDIDPATLEAMMLKLILQPIVENAVYHGLREKRSAGIIRLSARLTDTQIIISIEDDGAGMSQARINEVISGKSREKKKGFGLYSMTEKLGLFYDKADILSIESVEGQGTKVTLALPFITDEDIEEEIKP